MGYKVLGYVVWQGGKWWVRRRLSGTPAKLAVAAVGAAILAGVLAGARQVSSDE